MSRADGSRRVALAALLVASTLTVMAGAILSPVLELIRRDLALSDTGAGLVLTVHGFSLAVVAPLVGRAIDRWSLRPTLVWGLLLYGVSGGAGLVTNSYTLLLASRLVFGIGAAAVFAATTVALFELYGGPARDRVMGWRSSAISLGGLGWPLVGGTLGALSWHAPFALYLLAVPLAVACAAALPAMPAETAGAEAPDGGLRALARRSPDLIGSYAMQLIGAVLLYAMLVLLPLRLAELAVTDPRYVAICVAALSAAMTAVGFGYALLRARLGDRALVTLAFFVWLAALASLSIVQQPVVLGAAAALFGIGMGVAVPALTVLVAEAAPAPLRGRATSLSASATFLGQAASPLLLGPIVSATSITTGFAVAAALAGTTLLTTLAAGARRRSEVTA
jgi:MFS transporter, ACDE family, multidrug resistance protein